MANSEIRVLVNNQSAFNHTTTGTYTLMNASYVMTAPSTNTQICFNYSLSSGWPYPATAPCLDNITLEHYVPIFDPTSRSTIICDGDFEAYHMLVKSDYLHYVWLLPNYNCWYDRGGGIIEFQTRVNMNTTNVADLSTNYPYVLCQNVSLVVGEEYQLNFTVFNQLIMKISEILLLINGVSVYNHTTLNQFNRSIGSFIFVASSNNTQICFDYILNMAWANREVGPCLDNITI